MMLMMITDLVILGLHGQVAVTDGVFDNGELFDEFGDQFWPVILGSQRGLVL